jgi:hypothetical protein
LQESQAEIWDTEAVLQEATFHCASTDSADLCPKAEPPGTKRSHLIYPSKQVTEAKGKV